MAYIGTSPSNGVRRVHTYTATANQTTFTGSSTEGVTLTYADTNYIDVFQNGVLLGSVDYTSTSGTSVVLAQGASVSDLVVIVVYDVFSVADTVSKTSGGSFDSAVTMSGGLRVADGGNIGSASDTDAMAISSGGVVTFSQAPVFSSGGGGSVEKLSTVTTTGATSVDFDSSLITDTFMTYRIIGSNARNVTNNTTPELLLSIDNGSNFNLNVRGGKFHQRIYANQTGTEYYGADGSVHQLGSSVSNNATVLAAFDITVYNTRGTVGIKYVQSQYISNLQGDSDGYLWHGASRVNTTSAINLLRLKSSSGNIAGTFTLYGIRA